MRDWLVASGIAAGTGDEVSDESWELQVIGEPLGHIAFEKAYSKPVSLFACFAAFAVPWPQAPR